MGSLSGPLAAQSGSPAYGPFRVTERNPLYRLYLTPRGASADPVADGRLEVRSAWSYSNILEVSNSPTHIQYFDLERLTTTVSAAYGVTPSLDVGLRVASQANGGGFLDGFIRGWHDFFGFSNGARDRIEDGLYGVFLQKDGEERLDIPSGTRLEDLRLFATWAALGETGGPGRLSLRGTLKVPTGSSAVSTGRVDAGLELLARRSWGKAHLHGSLGVVTLNAPDELEPFTSDHALTWSLAVEYRLFSKVSALAQLLGTSRYVGGFGDSELDQVPVNLVLGAAGEVGDDWFWEASFAEDPVPNGPSVDFTVDLQIARAFDPGR